MKIFLCILIGYLAGTLNPAALISKLKRKSLRENGTGNLGATNTSLVFGKKFGLIVMLFDILKGFLAVKLATLINSEVEWLPLAAGFATIVGHCFPFYLKFKGGKGLAAFAGVVLAYDTLLFLFLLITGVIFMIIVNYSFILPYYASTVFSVFVCVTDKSLNVGIFAIAASVLIMIMHFSNILKAKRGQDLKIRQYIKNKILKK